jgi:hypothetical protein
VPDYDQAARNIACMVEVLYRAGNDTQFQQLGFYVLAPQSQIAAKVFSTALDRENISKKIEARVKQYCRISMDAVSTIINQDIHFAIRKFIHHKQYLCYRQN